MNVLLAKLWLSFWHLLPANLILVRVVHGGSRRSRHLWLRVGYLGALLFVVLFSLVMTWQSGSLAELAKGASQTFKWASTAQLLLMCFLAPVFTASAITQERDAQTFNILLSTPLSSAQIVLGSLMSRLYFVITLLLSGLPIFLMTMVYGGVTTRQIVESFALCGSTAILTGALAIFVAMIGVGTRRTIFSFYLLIALYLLVVYLLGRWDRTWIESAPANIAGLKMSWLTPLHPFLALDVALNRIQAPSIGHLAGYSAISRNALANPSATYVLWTTVLALVLIVLSMFFVRRGAKSGEATILSNIIDRFRRKAAGERTHKPRNVWANPVAWREATARASSAMVRWAIILGGLLGSSVLLVYYYRGDLPSGEVAMWLAGLTAVQVAVAWLIATNTAATSMTKEKESKTMDLLLTTPLTSKYILWGKLRGLVSFAAPLLAGPILVLLVFATIALFRNETPPVVWFETGLELGALLVVYTALACVIGLRFSLTSKTNVSAVMSSVGLVIILGGFASIIGLAMVDASRGEFGAFLAPFTPYTSINYLINPAALFNNNAKDFAAGAPAVRMAAFIGCLIAIVSYAFVVWRWYVGLVRDFDMTMRKQAGN